MIGVEEAWRWVQIGFCVGLGACVPLSFAALWARAVVHVQHVERPETFHEPHCQVCCPELEAD
jgi:hypothetical protein